METQNHTALPLYSSCAVPHRFQELILLGEAQRRCWEARHPEKPLGSTVSAKQNFMAPDFQILPWKRPLTGVELSSLQRVHMTPVQISFLPGLLRPPHEVISYFRNCPFFENPCCLKGTTYST